MTILFHLTQFLLKDLKFANNEINFDTIATFSEFKILIRPVRLHEKKKWMTLQVSLQQHHITYVYTDSLPALHYVAFMLSLPHSWRSLKKTHTDTTNCRLILKWVTSVLISLTIIFRNKRAERWLWRRLVELLKIISVVIILVNSCHISKMRIQFCILSNFCTNLDYVCVIKWWRVELGNNFTRVLSKFY